MAVLIGHASQSETGTINGVPGDTGNEVVTRNWYNGTWGFVAIHPDESVREKIATAIEQACANSKIGYGQSDRNTLHTYAKAKSYDLSKITTKCNCDCSSLVNVAVVAAGKGTYGSNGWTTSTLQAQLKALGFEIVTSYLTSEIYCVRGAIYVRAGYHTVVALGNGTSYKTMLSKAGISTSSTIAVDGYWGTGTTTKAQEVYGTVQDGVISGQSTSNKKYHTNCQTSSWKYGSGGSLLIKAIQKSVGVSVDGYCGPDTIKAIQKLVGTTQDGYMGPNTVKAFQKYLNTK